jgi:hypothetical protein
VDPLAATPDEQHPRVDDERLLLTEVDVQWPAVRAFDGFDVRPQNLVRGTFIAPDPNPAALQDLRVAHSQKSIGRAPIRCISILKRVLGRSCTTDCVSNRSTRTPDTPYNPTGRFDGSSRQAIESFKTVLDRARIPATVRLTRGRDIEAACGQLASTR